MVLVQEILHKIHRQVIQWKRKKTKKKIPNPTGIS